MENKQDAIEKMEELSGRQRKKLYNKLRVQMEFYFSNSNLAKDKFLYSLIQQNSNGYVDLEIFKTFNKIKALSENTDLIAASLSKSDILELSDDKLKVRRKSPIELSKDFDSCTLYVEGLPLYADHKWIKDVFGQFGTVEYINIPRFKNSQKLKGFAFIEFSSPESVVKACQFYKISSKEKAESEEENTDSEQGKVRKAEDLENRKSKKLKMCSDDEAIPKMSDHAVNVAVCLKDENSDVSEEDSDSSKNIKKKRKLENIEVIVKVKSKKAKLHLEKVTLSDLKSERDTEEFESENNHVLESSLATECESVDLSKNGTAKGVAENETSNKVKKKRNHSKKNRNRRERPIIRVMSKDEWKSYRNKYLDLQRTTMSYLKKQILLECQEMREQEMNSKLEPVQKKELTFQPGVIIKLKVLKPIENPSDIKEQIKACAVVAYIDAPMGEDEIFIRCHTAEDAASILQEKKLNHLGDIALLTDSKEKDYWEKIKSDREAKFNSSVTRKRRGRDKLISKSAKLLEQKNKHIYFDE